MPSIVNTNQNYAEWQIRGEIDLSTAAAVTTNRGDGQTATKTATGTYQVRIKGAQGLRASQVLGRQASVQPILAATALGTALFARVSNVAHDTGNNSDDVLITIITSATQGGAAADNTTTAETVAFEVIVRSGSISSYP